MALHLLNCWAIICSTTNIQFKEYFSLVIINGSNGEPEKFMSNNTWCLGEYNLSFTAYNFARLKMFILPQEFKIA